LYCCRPVKVGWMFLVPTHMGWKNEGTAKNVLGKTEGRVL